MTSSTLPAILPPPKQPCSIVLSRRAGRAEGQGMPRVVMEPGAPKVFPVPLNCAVVVVISLKIICSTDYVEQITVTCFHLVITVERLTS